MYRALHIAGEKELVLRFKFRAVDNTIRCIFQVDHVRIRTTEDEARAFVNQRFINGKVIKAANAIISKYGDRVNRQYQASYMVMTTYRYQGKTWWIGVPLHWQSPRGDSVALQYTNLNFGKLTTFIVGGRPVDSSPKHPEDIPIRIAAETGLTYEAVIYV